MYSMLTDREREYLRTFALKEYAGQGAIVILAAGWAHPRSRLQAGSVSAVICNFGQLLSTRTIDLSGTAG
jgi:hypothetical protein